MAAVGLRYLQIQTSNFDLSMSTCLHNSMQQSRRRLSIVDEDDAWCDGSRFSLSWYLRMNDANQCRVRFCPNTKIIMGVCILMNVRVYMGRYCKKRPSACFTAYLWERIIWWFWVHKLVISIHKKILYFTLYTTQIFQSISNGSLS